MKGRLSGFRLLYKYRDPLSVISDLAVLSAATLVSLSAETVGLKLQGACDDMQDTSRCFVTIAAFPGVARIVEALLSILLISILTLAVLLARWRSGIAVHPSSPAALCALLQLPESGAVLERLREVAYDGDGDLDGKIGEKLEGIVCRLGRVDGAVVNKRGEDYGIIAVETDAERRPPLGSTTISTPKNRRRSGATAHVPNTERVLQGTFLFLICSLLAILLYYENTKYGSPYDTPFEYFMDSQGFGVRTLFTSLGVIICFIWESHFSSKYRSYPTPGIQILQHPPKQPSPNAAPTPKCPTIPNQRPSPSSPNSQQQSSRACGTQCATKETYSYPSPLL